MNNLVILSLRRGLLLGAAIVAVWILFLGGTGPTDSVLAGVRTSLYPLLAGITATLLAFVFAAESVLLGFASNGRLAVITKSGRFSDLTRVFADSVRSLGIATIAAVLALLFDQDKSPSPTFVCILLLTEAWVVSDIIRCVSVFEKVRLLLVAPSKARSGDRA